MAADNITAYIGIGSNLGERENHLKKAVNALDDTYGIKVTKVSPFYNTAPVGYTAQPDFLNGVVEIETSLSPYALLDICHQIEEELRRVRTIRWGPRTIDLDILLYADIVMSEEKLVIPHPAMHEREFVLRHFNDISPYTVHPVTKLTIRKMYLCIDKQYQKR